MIRRETKVIETIVADDTGKKIKDGGWTLGPIERKSDQPVRHFQGLVDLMAWLLSEERPRAELSASGSYLADELRKRGINVEFTR